MSISSYISERCFSSSAMAKTDELTDEQTQPLTHDNDDAISRPGTPRRSFSSVSTTSLVLENVSHKAAKESLYRDGPQQQQMDMDDQLAWQRSFKPADSISNLKIFILPQTSNIPLPQYHLPEAQVYPFQSKAQQAHPSSVNLQEYLHSPIPATNAPAIDQCFHLYSPMTF